MKGSPNYVAQVAENLREAVSDVAVRSADYAKGDHGVTTARGLADALNLANQLINDLERMAKQ